jgi:predicted cupin superfamily sugar epimerase
MKFRKMFKGRYLLRSAENLTADGYTFVSCVTAPEFRCEDFRLVPDREIRERLEQR